MRVLHLPYGIGISIAARALRAQGVDATSCSFHSAGYYDYLADIRLNLDRYPPSESVEIRKAFFKEAVDRYDVFHFHFGETFLPDKSDLKILARMGKTMVAEHRGSDVRIGSVARSFNNPYVRVKKIWPEPLIRRNLRVLSSSIEHAVVPDRELLPYVEGYYKHVHIVPRAIETGRIQPFYPPPQPEPLVVHAPSNREVKGTAHLLSAVERLRKEGVPFRFRLIEKLPHEQAMRLYRECAVVVDQLLIGSYANLSMEAMAMGKPAICYIREDLLDAYPPGLPIVNANPETIYDVLKRLLTQPERWNQLGRDGRRYVERHHSLENAASRLLNVYHAISGT
ncbi:glycosyltransferase [Paenibacillus antri]|uniref:Glycosyltransferase n=1 Tax=Paenibacillus antri TaxID=2582848 RepID=A0A5R9G3B7_9BACL|nr:glycosyltransferase [Paenibacillus antri]TLS50847.1 glycosyltransferase [Paenibacillus antri]